VLDGVGWSMPRPGRFTPGKTRFPLYRSLSGPQGQSRQVRKISPPTGIRSPDCPAHCKSLYQLLSYPSPCVSLILNYFETPFVSLYNVADSKQGFELQYQCSIKLLTFVAVFQLLLHICFKMKLC